MALKVSMLGLSPEINIWTGGPAMKGDVVAVDTETLLIDMEAPWIYPEVVVLTAYGGGSTVDLVTCKHIPEYVTKLLKRKCILAFHNAPFDLGVLGMDQFVEHIENGLIVDTGLQWVLRKLSTQGISDENREYPGLARVVYDLFHEKLDKDEGVRLTFTRDMDLDDAHQIYACGDAVATWRAAMLMGPQPTMATQVKGFLTMDFISRTGFLVDKDYMRETRNIHLKKMDEAANRLMSWGIKAAKDPETSEIWKWMVEELDLVLPAESAQKLPVTLARNILHFSLGASSVHEVAEWLKTPEFTSALLDPTERMPFVKDALTKRQAFGCLWKVLNNLMDLKPPSEGLQDYWESHEGWPAGYKERSSTTILQDLMVEAEKSLGIKLPRTDGGSTGKRKMAINEEALATLDDETLKQLPFLESWKDYAHSQNMVSTYLDEKILWKDGRIHPRFCPLMATGRVSARAPNVQNPPKEERMREHYIADPGYVLNSCDYSQQELVCLAQDCYTEYGFSTMRDLINNDIDLHGYIAARIGKKFEDLPRIDAADPELIALYKEIIEYFKEDDKGKFKFLRALAKALNFGSEVDELRLCTILVLERATITN